MIAYVFWCAMACWTLAVAASEIISPGDDGSIGDMIFFGIIGALYLVGVVFIGRQTIARRRRRVYNI